MLFISTLIFRDKVTEAGIRGKELAITPTATLNVANRLVRNINLGK
jgi:hypothetical protein